MNRRILLLPLSIVAALGMASCAGDNPDSSSTIDSMPTSGESSSSSSRESSTVKAEVSVTLDKTSLSIEVGDTSKVVATVSGSDDTTVTWSTSDETIATVKFGVITAVKVGTATIKATSNADPTKSAEVAVTITEKAAKTLSSIKGPVATKETYYGVITAITSDGFIIEDGTGALYVYKTLTSSYAVGDYVSVTGKIVSYYGLLEVSDSVSVKKATGTAPTLKEATALTGDIIDTVQAQYTDGDKESGWTTGFHLADMGPYTFTAKAHVSSNYAYFYLDDDSTSGYKLSPSKYTGEFFVNDVTYTLTGYFGGLNSKSKTYQFFVKGFEGQYSATESVAISGGTDSITAGSGVQLAAAASPATARQLFTWSSNDTKVATVNADGYVQGIAAGKATITVTSVADNTKTATKEITVEDAPEGMKSVTFDWSSAYQPDSSSDTEASWTKDEVTAKLAKNKSSSKVSDTMNYIGGGNLRIYKNMKFSIQAPGNLYSITFLLKNSSDSGATCLSGASVTNGYSIVTTTGDEKNAKIIAPGNSTALDIVTSGGKVFVISMEVSYISQTAAE